jgi:hypothetical protein
MRLGRDDLEDELGRKEAPFLKPVASRFRENGLGRFREQRLQRKQKSFPISLPGQFLDLLEGKGFSNPVPPDSQAPEADEMGSAAEDLTEVVDQRADICPRGAMDIEPDMRRRITL